MKLYAAVKIKVDAIKNITSIVYIKLFDSEEKRNKYILHEMKKNIDEPYNYFYEAVNNIEVEKELKRRLKWKQKNQQSKK